MIYAAFLILMFWLGGESGASFPWSQKWQKGFGFDLAQVPEIVTAMLLGFVSMQGYQKLGLDVDFYVETGIFIFVTVIIYGGIQAANWLFLKWKDSNPNNERTAKIKPVVDRIAALFGWKLGDEGYSWVAAAIKGTIITLPMGGLGGILFAMGYEIGSHSYRINKWINPHIIAEGMSFVGIAVYALMFLTICQG